MNIIEIQRDRDCFFMKGLDIMIRAALGDVEYNNNAA